MRVVGIGDSVGFGVGDIGQSFIGPGWAGRLGSLIKAERVIHLALPGARVADLEISQVPAAIAARAEIALISVGGNDVLRADFNPTAIEKSLRKSLTELRAVTPIVVVLGLPDPLRTAPLPYLVKRALSRRTIQLNQILLQVAKSTRCIFISNWHEESVYLKPNWHVDRMHPSPKGYQSLAQRTLRQLGLKEIGKPIGIEHSEEAPNRIVWLLIFGSIWFIRRSKDLIPRLLLLTFLEVRDVLLRRPLEVATMTEIEDKNAETTAEEVISNAS